MFMLKPLIDCLARQASSEVLLIRRWFVEKSLNAISLQSEYFELRKVSEALQSSHVIVREVKLA